MTRGNKKFLSAIFIAMFVFAADIYILGLAASYAETSNGVITAIDAVNLSTLMKDEAFRELYKWGPLMIESTKAFILLFVIIPIIAFILTLLLSFREK
jgi:hypothetical protein